MATFGPVDDPDFAERMHRAEAAVCGLWTAMGYPSIDPLSFDWQTVKTVFYVADSAWGSTGIVTLLPILVRENHAAADVARAAYDTILDWLHKSHGIYRPIQAAALAYLDSNVISNHEEGIWFVCAMDRAGMRMFGD